MNDYKGLLRSSIRKIQERDRRIRELEAGLGEPVAIVGMSGRFPGGATLESFWELIEQGRDAVATMRAQRWNMDDYYGEQGLAGKIYTRRFGLLDDVDRFDPAAFGMAAGEAASIDPQHRLLLEQAWFCFERAGFDVGGVKGAPVGVFIGQMQNDYARLVKDIGDLTPSFGIGNALSAAAGRLSYTFGLTGPSISIDTACSSSLVAVHLACQSLRTGECSMALAGGVNLLLSPEGAVGASLANMLSRVGRCNTFGAGADGYVRSEGCGLVLLKTLSRAQADGDPILAVICGSAVNQDGRSNGLSAPNGPAQVDVMTRALRNAQRSAGAISYLEAHGTGTPLGDPVEVQSIDAVYGRGAGRVEPLVLGAVKANIGHCESAAGIAGLIKVVMMLQRSRLPPIAHLTELNPHFRNLSDRLAFPRVGCREWEAGSARIAALSSFGYTGTNAHMIVEQYIPPEAAASAPPPQPRECVVCFSAHSATALREQLLQTAELLREHSLRPEELEVSVNRIRGDLPHRTGLVFRNSDELCRLLFERASEEPGEPVARPRLAFYFDGAGPSSLDDLTPCLTLIAAERERLEAALRDTVGMSLQSFSGSFDGQSAALRHFATQFLRASLWLRLKATPEALYASGPGSLAAAVVAGALPIEIALAIASAYDRPGSHARIDDLLDTVTVADCELPLRLVQSQGFVEFPYGDATQARSWFASALCDGGGAADRNTFVQLVSADSARACVALDLARNRVLVANAPGKEILATPERAGLQLSSFPAALATLFSLGASLDWRALYAGRSGQFRYLFDYPFARDRHWLPEHITQRVAALPALFGRIRHAVLSTVFAEPQGNTIFSGELSLATLPLLKAHQVHGQIVVPASAFVDMILAAASHEGMGLVHVSEMTITQPCRLEERPLAVYCRAHAVDEATAEIDIFTRVSDSAEWRHHVSARVVPQKAAPVRHHDLESYRKRCPVSLDVTDYYSRARRDGVEYGAMFRALRSVSRGTGCALARIELPQTLSSEAGRHVLHPVLLDAGLQAIAAATGASREGEGEAKLFVPSEFRGLDHRPNGEGACWCFVRILGGSTAEWSADELARYLRDRESFAVTLSLWALDGSEIVSIERLEAVRYRRSAALPAREAWQDWIFHRNWAPAAARDLSATFVPLDDLLEFGRRQLTRLRSEIAGEPPAPALHELEELAATYVREAFAALGVSPASELSAATLIQKHNVRADYERLCKRLIEILPAASGTVSAGTLESRLRGACGLHGPCGEGSAELDLIKRCGEALAPVLQGRVNPLDLLFERSGAEGTAAVYRDSSGTRLLNGVLAEVIAHAVRSRRGTKRVRVLEVGAGTGATTAYVLPMLSDLDVEYVYSDISAHFLNAAAQTFREYPFVDYRTLDITVDPAAQALRAGEFDIVVAVNVLHATPDLEVTLRNLGFCLAQGGLLLLRELTQQQAWLDISFGLTPGWWSFRDFPLRTHGPLLDPDQWQALLARSGFNAAAVTAAAAAESVFVASKAAAARQERHWVLFSDGGAASSGLERQLIAGQDRVTRVAAAGVAGEAAYELSPQSPAAFSGLFERIEREQGPITGVLYAWSLSEADVETVELATAIEPYVRHPLLLCQAVLEPRWRKLELTFLTVGSQSVEGGVLNPLPALLWGHVFSFVNENGLFARLIDLDPAQDDAREVTAELDYRDECQIAFRKKQRHVARLQTADLGASGAPNVRPEASYLITGGFGDLGLETARALGRQGARHIILVGRHPRVAAESEVLRELESAGVTIHGLAVDVADEAALTRELDRVLPHLPPLKGIVHSVGVLDDGVIQHQSWERYLKVLGPKVFGAVYLHRATRALELDFFVVYSSAAGVMGNPGQANHAAANAFLDAFSWYRQALGRPSLAIDWGAWAQIGAAANTDIARQLAQEHSLVGMIPPDQGRSIVARQFGCGGTQLAVIPFRADVRPDPGQQPYLQTLLADILEGRRQPGRSGIAEPHDHDIRAQLLRMAATDRRRSLDEYLRRTAARLLNYRGVIEREVSLFELGLDSLLAIDLRMILERDFARALEATLLFDYPNIASLGELLLQGLATSGPMPAAGAAASVATTGAVAAAEADLQAIAIVGMGCRFPGGAKDPELFWELLKNGVDTAERIPPERWDHSQYFHSGKFKPGKIYVDAGCFVDQVDQFYPERYGISGIEANLMDPQQRLLLDVCYEALEGAGMAPRSLSGRDVGVFMGIMTQDYLQLTQHVRENPFYVGTGTANSVVAGRISHVFGLMGPTMTVDCACSSSLVTVQLACLNLRSKTCDMALAGGVSLQLSPQTMVLECAGGMLSPTGRCRTFDADADGFLRGEGCGVVVLKRLADALAQGDPVLGIIRGAAVTHDGTSGGLTVPNGLSQQRVLEKALRDGAVAAEDVSYVEAHGTGTSLGDPIELNALSAVYGAGRGADNPLLIGSVKTNIGHAEAAAGIAGLLKVVLSLRHREIPPHLHLRRRNPNFDWTRCPLVIPDTLIPWDVKVPRRASVSSFGLSGTNAHVVLEEYMPTTAARTLPPDFVPLAILSNVGEDALRADAAAYALALEQSTEEFSDICYTLCVARASQPVKAVLAARSKEHLVEDLRAIATGSAASAACIIAARAGSGVAFRFTVEPRTQGFGTSEAEAHYRHFDAFRRCIDAGVDYLRKSGYAGVSAEDFFTPGPVSMPEHFVAALLQLAYAQLLVAIGITPQLLFATGPGVFSAAHLIGALDIETTLRGLLGGRDPAMLLELVSALNLDSLKVAIQFEHGPGLPDAANLAITHKLAAAFSIQQERSRELAGNCIPLATGCLPLDRSEAWRHALPRLAALLIQMIEIGQPIEWSQYFAAVAPRRVTLPTTRFPARRYWVPEQERGADRSDLAAREFLSALDRSRYLNFELSAAHCEFLQQHSIRGARMLPAAASVAFILRALQENLAQGGVLLERLVLLRPVVFEEQLAVQLVVTTEGGGQLYFAADPAAPLADWQQFSVVGRMGALAAAGPEAAAGGDFSPRSFCAAATLTVPRESFYADHIPGDLELGPSYQRIQRIWRKGRVALALIRNISAAAAVDPRALDACLQAVNFIETRGAAQATDLFLPFSLESARIHRWPDTEQFWCRVEYLPDHSSDTELVYDLAVLDEKETACAGLHRIAFRKVSLAAAAAKAPTVAAAHGPPAREPSTLRAQLAALALDEQLTGVADFLRRTVCEFLKIEAGAVPADRPFFDLGMDSLTAVEFSQHLSEVLALDLHVDTVFDYPSIASLSGYLRERIAPTNPSVAVTAAVGIAQSPLGRDAPLEDLVTLLRQELGQE